MTGASALPIAIGVLSIATVILGTWGLYLYLGAQQRAIAARLRRLAAEGKVKTSREIEMVVPLSQRVVKPALDRLVARATRLTPAGIKESVRQKLEAAGHPWGLTPEQFIFLKGLATVVTPLVAFVLGLGLGFARAVLLAAVGFVLGSQLPEFILRNRTRARVREIQKALPDVLDLLTVSVEAGLGFDSAVAKVVEKRKGPLCDELNLMLQEIRMGKPRREALRALSSRAQVEDLSAFIAALIQADQLGVSIANILRIQSDQMRTRRRQRAEEAAMKAPIKILIPLVFLVFPTLFVVLLGPAVIRMLETFAGLKR